MTPLNEFRYLVLAAQRDGNRLLSEALRPLDLTPAQAEVLVVLAQRPPLSLAALGERLVCETGSPSRLVASMVASGWLERRPDPHDARCIRLSLTPAGAALARQAAAIEGEFQAELELLLAGLPLQSASEALWRIVAHLPSGRALRRRLAEEPAHPPRP